MAPTDGSKAGNRVVAAATSNNVSAQVTAELQALKMAFNVVKNCDWDRFIIFTDSLSSLQALDSNNCDHLFIQDILKLFNDCLSVNKKVVLAWVPSHVGIKGKITLLKITLGDFYVWTGLSHREEIVITRARIGHTYFTHSYLLKGEEMPWCIPCHCPDTVKHILLDCINLRDTRIKYYRNVNTMKKLFCENVFNIINYLKECGLYKKF